MGRQKSGKTNFRDMTNGIVAGVDLGDSTSMTTVISPIGDVTDKFQFSMDESGYSLFQSRVPACAKIAFEATTMSCPFSRTLKTPGYSDVTVAHPKQLLWITKSKKKNDRVDSPKIAKLHQAGMIPESHLLDRDEQIARDLLIQRVNLGLEINRIKSKILSYLKREGVNESLPKTSDNFSLARRRAILLMKFDDDRDLVLRTMMDRLEFFDKQSFVADRTVFIK
ncbi:MAG: transposase [Nitrososphaerota archaeon]|nr:transposase [Nitrososphaerota archaeon]